MRFGPVSVSIPMRISWACTARRMVRPRWSRATSWRLVSSSQRRDGLEIGVDPVEEGLGQLGERVLADGPPATRPGAAGQPGPGSACARAWAPARSRPRAGGRWRPVPAHDDDGLGRIELGGGGRSGRGGWRGGPPSRSGGTHRSLLELGERLGEGLGHRPRPVDRARKGCLAPRWSRGGTGGATGRRRSRWPTRRPAARRTRRRPRGRARPAVEGRAGRARARRSARPRAARRRGRAGSASRRPGR